MGLAAGATPATAHQEDQTTGAQQQRTEERPRRAVATGEGERSHGTRHLGPGHHFGGHGRVDASVEYPVSEKGKLTIYSPARTAMVFAPV